MVKGLNLLKIVKFFYAIMYTILSVLLFILVPHLNVCTKVVIKSHTLIGGD
jgi:hypothetical protein